MRSFLVVVLVPLLCAACVAPPTPDQITRASIGDPPDAELVEQLVRDYLHEVLKDPESLRLRVGAVQRGWYRAHGHAPNKFAWYCACGVNAKNSYGGYTGEELYEFFFLRDQLVAVGTIETTFSRYGSSDYAHVIEMNGGGLTAEQAGLKDSKTSSGTGAPTAAEGGSR